MVARPNLETPLDKAAAVAMLCLLGVTWWTIYEVGFMAIFAWSVFVFCIGVIFGKVSGRIETKRQNVEALNAKDREIDDLKGRLFQNDSEHGEVVRAMHRYAKDQGEMYENKLEELRAQLAGGDSGD